MATYQFSFHPFGTAGTGLFRSPESGAEPSARPVGAILTPGATFRLTDEPGLTLALQPGPDGAGEPLPVLSDDPGIPVAWRGQPVLVACRITARPDPASRGCPLIEMLVVRIGPNPAPALTGGNVGLVCRVPLEPAALFTVVEVTEADSLRGHLREGDDARPVSSVADWNPLGCLTWGTLIDTPDGPRPVETLAPGDLVTTLSNASQRLRWTGRRPVTAAEMHARPALRTVEFDPGTIGNARPLRLSRQHRVLLNDWRAQVYFGEDEVLIAAHALLNGRSVREVIPPEGAIYIHLLFDRHEVILAEGALTESLHPGEIALGALDATQRQEVEALFPGLPLASRPSAFPIVKPSEASVARLLT